MRAIKAPRRPQGSEGAGRSAGPAARTISHLRRVVLAFMLALALGYVPHQVYGQSGLARLFALKRSLGELRRHNEAARVENARLKEQSAALQKDPRALERVARDELGLVKPGEVVY